MKTHYVYIMTNHSGTLYTGITNNLEHRIYEHKHDLVPGFASKYKLRNWSTMKKGMTSTQRLRGRNRSKVGSRAKKLH